MLTGNEVRMLRGFKNISQRGLAAMLGKSQQYVSRLENFGAAETPAYRGQKIINVLSCQE